jgi:SAM-dependent methyltransferase
MSTDINILEKLSANSSIMLDKSASIKIIQALDIFHLEQASLEWMTHSLPLDSVYRTLLGERISRSSHALANTMIDILGDDADGWSEASNLLRRHPAHDDYLLKSEFIRRTFEKSCSYAVNKDLILLMCRNEDIGETAYLQLANRVYQDLPVCQSVRQSVRGMERILRRLPDGSRVLCLACGPAWEVQRMLDSGPAGISIDLLDHDPQTLDYTMGQIADRNIRHVRANAFDIIKGRTSFPYAGCSDDTCQEGHRFGLETASYDLVYTMGLYDCLPHFPMNPGRGTTGLTAQLFSFLKPGGELYAGNFLKPGRVNPHGRSHQFMMEAYCDWKPIYRTPEEIRGFASAIRPETVEAAILDESLERPAGAASITGFLHLRCRR